MKERTSTFSISRDVRKRFSYFMFCVIFLSSVANFMFVILPRILHPPSEHIKVNQVLCEEKNQSVGVGKSFEIEKDEFSHIKNVHEHDSKVNQKYCNGKKCKFLLAYFPPAMMRDTSKIITEYMTYVKLAELLGRTMILTNIGSKRISTCQNFPFDHYYDTNKLQENFPKVNFISQDEFQKWTYHIIDKPSTSHYYLTDGGEENSIYDLPPYSDYLKKVWCFDRFKLKLNDTTPFKQLRISWNSWKNDERVSLENFLINSLNDNSEVLLIKNDIRRPLLNGLPSLPYAKHILDAATKTVNSMKPYVAINWDIEHTKSSILSNCASKLLTRVQKTIDNSSIENIYFASDYPLHRLNETNSTEPIIIQSYHRFSHLHTKAMNSISKTIPYHTVDSLGVMKSLEDELKYELNDSGIRDIIDKLVCIKADVYIGFPRRPCSDYVDSARSKTIVEARRKTGSPSVRF